MRVKKVIKIDERAHKELKKFSKEIQAKFWALFIVLEKEGFLEPPFAKRINSDLFEVRVSHKGQWRAIYTYFYKKSILVLSAFNKKTQKTQKKEIQKAVKRLKEHI